MSVRFLMMFWMLSFRSVRRNRLRLPPRSRRKMRASAMDRDLITDVVEAVIAVALLGATVAGLGLAELDTPP